MSTRLTPTIPAISLFPMCRNWFSSCAIKNFEADLPACIREPLKIVPDGNNDGTFVVNGFQLAKPDPVYEKSWGSFSAAGVRARGTFVSQPIKPDAMPYLEIPVAGDLGEAGLALDLVEVSTGKATPVKTSHAPGPQWVNLQVKTPPAEFKIVAHDDSETKWFAFKEPREMGWLSYWTMQMLHAWKCILVAGIICLLIGTVDIFKSKDQKPSSGAT